MILKSYIVENKISTLDTYKSAIFYGENIGLKDDIKHKIVEQNNGAEIINFFQDEIVKKKDILYEEINNTSLFNSKKIIFLHEITDKLYAEIEESLNRVGTDLKIFIFAGLLDKRSKLRSCFEKNNDLGIIPCYQDNLITLNNYIKTKLRNYSGLTQEVVNYIIENSSLDRKVINSEIKKIENFFTERKIDKNKIEDLLNIKTGTEFNQIRDATLTGNKTKVNKLIGEIEFLQEDNFFYLSQISTRINKLLEIQSINKSIDDTELAMDSLKPKIFWKDRPVYIEQLKRWNVEMLEQALSLTSETEIIMKKNSLIRSDLLIKKLLVNLCGQFSSVS